MATTRPEATVNSSQNFTTSGGHSALIHAAAQSYVNGQADASSLYDVMLALMARKMIDLAATVEVLHLERARKTPQYIFSTETFQPIKVVPKINEKEMVEEAARVINAISHAKDKWNLFALIMQYLKLDTRVTEYLAAQDAKNILAKIERMFVLDFYTVQTTKDILRKLCTKFNLPEDTVRRIVIPLAFAMQANNFLKHYEAQIIERFPKLEILFKAEEKASKPLGLRVVARGAIMFADCHFDTYDATLIRSTIFSEANSAADEDPWEMVAATPPRSTQEVEKFLDNTAFNLKCKVTDIVFFADKFKECVQSGEKFDMINWFFAQPGTQMQFGKYSVTVRTVSYIAEKNATHTCLDLLPPLSEKLSSQANRHVEFNLLVKNASGASENVVVCFFKTPNGNSLDLSRDHDFKKFYQLIVAKKKFAFSAANAEEAGYAVFLSVLTRHFEQVYVKGDMEVTIKKITALLKRLRMERPELMIDKNQFWVLIRVGIKLYQYHSSVVHRSSSGVVLASLRQAEDSQPYAVPVLPKKQPDEKKETKQVIQTPPQASVQAVVNQAEKQDNAESDYVIVDYFAPRSLK